MHLPQRFDVHDRARTIQLHLSQGIDPIVAAMEAQRVFADATAASQCKWLELELRGYEAVVGQSLRTVLNDSVGRLTAHVLAYRNQMGMAEDQPITHFFVESLSAIAQRRIEAAQLGAPTFELVFAPVGSLPGYSARFGSDAFDRIRFGFIAALHLQLGSLLR